MTDHQPENFPRSSAVTYCVKCRGSDVLNQITVLVVDAEVTQDIDQLLDNRIERRSESSIMRQNIFGSLDAQHSASDGADKSRNHAEELSILRSLLRSV